MSSCVSISPAASTVGQVIRHGGNGREEPHHTEDHSFIPVTQPRQQSGPVRTLVAMPAYNKEAYIAKTIVGAQHHADSVLIVDDDSKDDTVWHEAIKGYSGVLQIIFCIARGIGAEELVIIDVDSQHNPGDIPASTAPVLESEVDQVIGSRLLNTKVDNLRYRVAGHRMLNGFMNLPTSSEFVTTNSQLGFRALSYRALDKLTFASELQHRVGYDRPVRPPRPEDDRDRDLGKILGPLLVTSELILNLLGVTRRGADPPRSVICDSTPFC